MPSRAVLLIGALCFLAMMTEGAIGDWSGIYLRHDLGASAAAAATGVHRLLARDGGRAARRRSCSTSASAPARLLRGGMALVAVALGGVLLIGEPVPP